MSKIITVSDLNDYSPSTLDQGRASVVVDAVNTWIENKTSRCFGETKTVTERYDLKNVIWLRHQDVVEVDSVKLGYPNQTQQTLSSDAYYSNELGRLTLWFTRRTTTSAYNNDLLEISYTYGVTEAPADLINAALSIAIGFYNYVNNGSKDVTSSQVGSYRVQYAGTRLTPGRDPSGSTSDAMWSIVDSYATRRV